MQISTLSPQSVNTEVKGLLELGGRTRLSALSCTVRPARAIQSVDGISDLVEQANMNPAKVEDAELWLAQATNVPLGCKEVLVPLGNGDGFARYIRTERNWERVEDVANEQILLQGLGWLLCRCRSAD